MFRKLIAILGITAIFALFASSAALAAQGTSSGGEAKPGNRFGQVSTTGKNQFTLQNGKGEKTIVLVNSSTKFTGRNGDSRTFNNLGPRQWVNVAGHWDSKNNLVADTVIFVPGNTLKADWSNPRDFGRVTLVNPSANTFTISGQRGGAVFKVDSKTKYLSFVNSLNSLKAGMDVSVAYSKLSDGTKLAKAIIAYLPEK